MHQTKMQKLHFLKKRLFSSPLQIFVKFDLGKKFQNSTFILFLREIKTQV